MKPYDLRCYMDLSLRSRFQKKAQLGIAEKLFATLGTSEKIYALIALPSTALKASSKPSETVGWA
jgi:hypothetical protein